MRIPDSKVAEVAAAADIVEVISDYVELKRAGKDYRGLCPFHGDKDPSFYVSPQKEIFHCFGCAAGGSVFSFLMKIENITFVEAVRRIAARYGAPFEFEQVDRKKDDQKERITRALNVAHRFFRDRLTADARAQDYLVARGVSADWAQRLGLGFAPDSWNGLCERLNAASVDRGDAVAAGLVRPRATGGYYDYFRSRIMIPILDLSGGLVAFGGRVFGEGEPKYLNSPESAVFRKKGVLYGLESAREAVRREGRLVLVEGYFDQISLRIRGMENVAAPLGTALGSEQVRLAKRFSQRIVLVFDGDEAGIRAVKRSIPLFLAESLEPDCVILSEHKDPDEAVNRLGIDGFRSLLDGAVPLIDVFIEDLEANYDLKSLHGRNLAVEECLPILREIADSPERDYLIERFASRFHVREDRLRKLLTARKPHRVGSVPSSEAGRKSLFDFDPAERDVVRGMLLKDGFMDEVLERGAVKHMEDPILRSIAERMIAFKDRTEKFDSIAFCRSLDEQEFASVVASWMKPRHEEDDLRPEVDGDLAIYESLDRLCLRGIERRKQEIMERMKRCIPCDEEYNRLAQELLTIGRRLRR
ncbi:MAG: DNA primase [Deltaproteobacteria bacterium]|nr:DNA primase [Deltaproteobacteria bacterium]